MKYHNGVYITNIDHSRGMFKDDSLANKDPLGEPFRLRDSRDACQLYGGDNVPRARARAIYLRSHVRNSRLTHASMWRILPLCLARLWEKTNYEFESQNRQLTDRPTDFSPKD